MDAVITILAIAAMLLVAGGVAAMVRPGSVDWRWLVPAALLVVAYDAALTGGYGLLPNLQVGLRRNWQGMALGLALTLAVAAHPAIGWRRAGLTLRQAPGSLATAIPVALLYAGIFVGFAIAFPDDPPTGEEIAFQLTMPGLAEEVFYRGLLLYMLERAFVARCRLLGVDWGWGALASCALFGLAHAFTYANGAVAFDPLYFALTAGPALVAVWLRLRTGSVLLPVVLHNFGNAIGLLV